MSKKYKCPRCGYRDRKQAECPFCYDAHGHCVDLVEAEIEPTTMRIVDNEFFSDGC